MKENIKTEKKWYKVDAQDQSLGRLATKVAGLLRGKQKPNFSYNMDNGDFVVVVNLAGLDIDKDKAKAKEYFRHSGFPGGLKKRTLKEMKDFNICWVFENAVSGMLPHNRLHSSWVKRLKLYSGSEHKHQAQKLIEVKNGS